MKKENWEKEFMKLAMSGATAFQVIDFIRQEKSKDRQKFIDALIWCSASEDFQIGGKARKGWEKICKPLIKKSLTPEEWFKRKPPLK